MRFWYIVLIFLFMPLTVKAIDDCDGIKLSELAAKAGLIKYQHQYQNEQITLSAYNLDSSIYLKVGGKVINHKSGSAILGSYNQGDTVLIEVYTNVKLGCNQSNLLTKKYEILPYYNPYANDERCKTYLNLAVCNEFYEQPVSQEFFEESIRLYEEDLQNQKVDLKPIVEKPVPWFIEYKIYVIIAGVIIFLLLSGLLTSFIIKYRRNRSSL